MSKERIQLKSQDEIKKEEIILLGLFFTMKQIIKGEKLTDDEKKKFDIWAIEVEKHATKVKERFK